ncbi:MAG: class I SAM-dependent methyltransferase [Candidatus Promineifilaceae bacterium]|nr:class I SAM-dependent methyltransferase [Candidatus Promineifilaceae bacterium]
MTLSLEQPGADLYESIPYPKLSHKRTHPDRLGTLGGLLGMEPAPVENCRVLELGCAQGSNLIPMAYRLPNSRFVGLDYAAIQIEDGQRDIARLGLENIELVQGDILSPPDDLGQFDYIIAHGVWSWVPQPVRLALLTLIRDHMAPQGIAYVSYNVYPGWHMVNVIRDLMRYRTRHIDDPQEQVRLAKEVVHFMNKAIPEDESALGHFIGRYVDGILAGRMESGFAGDSFMLHDELSLVNDPCYFHEFYKMAQQHGLQYLTEAVFSSVIPNYLPEPIIAGLQEMSAGLVDMEQYLDYINNRSFRQTLLCHKEVTVQRRLKPNLMLDRYYSSRAHPEQAERPEATEVKRFRGTDGASLTSNHPLSQAAFRVLIEQAPRVFSFRELVEEALRLAPLDQTESLDQHTFQLAASLLQAYSYSGSLVDLHSYQPHIVTEISERPLASDIARWQAEHGFNVTNLLHERIILDNTFRFMVRHLDGTRTVDDLVALLQDVYDQGELRFKDDENADAFESLEERLAHETRRNLAVLKRAALLIG